MKDTKFKKGIIPELRYDLNNGVALCRECHKLTDNYKGKACKKI